MFSRLRVTGLLPPFDRLKVMSKFRPTVAGAWIPEMFGFWGGKTGGPHRFRRGGPKGPGSLGQTDQAGQGLAPLSRPGRGGECHRVTGIDGRYRPADPAVDRIESSLIAGGDEIQPGSQGLRERGGRRRGAGVVRDGGFQRAAVPMLTRSGTDCSIASVGTAPMRMIFWSLARTVCPDARVARLTASPLSLAFT
ncbi:MAG: hypothetical protein CM1200mP2_53060 [Planctomycetaceae bacterium]|nr:MAG: hypothetical protein CM1200mP2_53060 [Planctomycetaceae bacterium]